MNKNGPIIIIEDDQDDQLLLTQVLKKITVTNEIIFFEDPEEALTFLTSSDVEPFIVLSDINMPKLSGLELREKVHANENLRLKCIPYLFFTTSAEQQHVIDAYSKSVQGFFVKPSSLDKLEQIMRKIIDYWQECMSPDYVK
ncbi:response regulator [Spirosoma sp. HMF3257]|uniref:Response regulator n=1 Tax=Spirosoma telluris TaxID=2183553 RepID=A0A327NLQ5_9BACT|nr:response regulator [Spirosoma telluris]RAI74844.1 response regulator [Spirosoma telluris]